MARRAQQRVVEPGGGAGGGVDHLDLVAVLEGRRQHVADVAPSASSMRAVGREAVVEVDRGPVGDDVAGDATVDA